MFKLLLQSHQLFKCALCLLVSIRSLVVGLKEAQDRLLRCNRMAGKAQDQQQEDGSHFGRVRPGRLHFYKCLVTRRQLSPNAVKAFPSKDRRCPDIKRFFGSQASL